MKKILGLISLLIIIFAITSKIIPGISTNCIMNSDFSGKCIFEQTIKGFGKGLNDLQKNINKGLTLTGGIVNK